MQLTKKQLTELLSKQVMDQVGPVIERLQEQINENQKKFNEKNDELLAALAQQDRERHGSPEGKKQWAEDRSLKFARFCRFMGHCRNDMGAAAAHAKAVGDPWLAKALGESTLAGGGALVPEELAAGVIEFLRAMSVVRGAGPRIVPVRNGTLDMPRIAQGGTASFTGESTNNGTTEQTFGRITFTLRKLIAITPVSSELLSDASSDVDALVRDDLAEAVSVREDQAFLRGDGASDTPRGMTSFSQEKFDANATENVANVTNDLAGAIQRLEDNNIRVTRPHWFFAPRTKKALRAARTSDGVFAFRSEIDKGMLFGIPFSTTTQIPTNLTPGTNTEVILAEMTQLMIGDDPEGLEVRFFEGGTYFDGAALQSGISRDEDVIRLKRRVDFQARQVGNETVVIEDVSWDNITP